VNAEINAGGEIVLYESPEGGPALDVRLERETVWLSQRQMAELFDKDTDTVGLHIRNAFKEGELDEEATTEESSVVQTEGPRRVRRDVRFYNLDVIISVGYRVRSRRGTQFRIWATKVLRDHLVQGYTTNQKRLQELDKAVHVISQVVERRELASDEAKALLRVVADYSHALQVLDDYDHGQIGTGDTSPGPIQPITPDEVRRLAEQLAAGVGGSDIFGREQGKGLEAGLGAVMQTFDGRPLYPSLEEKAANLLYLLVKNHPFVDGNKRIAASAFLWFLDRNQALYRSDGSKRIADNALAALTLLVAESRSEDKDVLVSVVVNLINRKNP
jgi:prophage maintenance system killer protein